MLRKIRDYLRDTVLAVLSGLGVDPRTEILRLYAAASALYALAAGVHDAAVHRHGVPVDVVIAAATAIAALHARSTVTPLARPRTNDGDQLVPRGSIKALTKAAPLSKRAKKAPARRR